jgi:adenosylmethionine-8-amino-7-oxononanoate aminotransferase
MSELKNWFLSEKEKKVISTKEFWVYFEESKEPKLDLTCGWSSFVLGYNNEEIINSIHEKFKINFLRGNTGESCEQVDELSSLICSLGNWSGISWAVSGSDAVESSVAMNDEYWKLVNQEKTGIISFTPCYHGTTMLGKHLRGEYKEINRAFTIEAPKWRVKEEREKSEDETIKKILYLLENNHKKIGAIIFESCPWIEDILPWSENWWKKIKKICDIYNLNFILDDVAVCWGKQGHWFGYQNFNIQPDICSIGKALTGGYSPLGASVCNSKIYSVISKIPWKHGHTWQPNMHGVISSLEVTRYIKDNNLFKNVPAINCNFKSISEKYGLNIRGDHLVVVFDLPKKITSQSLYEAGFTSAFEITGNQFSHMKISAPLIANDEYFHIIEKGIKKIL